MYDQGTVGHCDHRRLKRPIVPIATITKTPFAKDVAVRAVGKRLLLSVRLDAGGKIRSRKPYYILPIAH